MGLKRFGFFLILGLLLQPVSAFSAPQILRDAETETALQKYATPIFRSAGLDPSHVQIVLVSDDAVNAFVAGGQNIFIHSGLILATKDLDELLGVIAHETGHIAGGHLVRMREAVENASREAMLATILGLAVGVASSDSSAGAGTAAGGQQVTERLLLRFTRAQETSADQAGMNFLTNSDIPVTGLYHFLQRMKEDEGFVARDNEYVRTHPLTQSRMEAVNAFLKQHPSSKSLPPAAVEQYQRIRLKLLGYVRPQEALEKARADNSIAAQYGKAVASFRLGLNDTKGIEALLRLEPDNPYFYELKGQMDFGAGRLDEAEKSLSRAVKLAPDSALILTLYGQILLEKNQDNAAIPVLKKALQSEPDLSFAHRLLATAYGKTNQPGPARLHLAEEALLQRNYARAREDAKNALRYLKPGTADALRADDVLSFAEQRDKNKK